MSYLRGFLRVGRPAAIWLLLALAPVTAGAYQIGHATIEFLDPARGQREILTGIYYPAEVSGEEVPVALPPVAGFPVVAFGHGFLISAADYDFVWEGLVPAGYVVAVPRTEGGFTPSHLDLGLDLAFLCAALQAEGEDPQSPFYGAIAAASAVGGHSMGGGASVLGAASDPTITALFNFAAAETNPSAIAAAAHIAAPALLFAGALDCVTPPETHQLPMYDALASDCRTYIELAGASHCQFAEYNFLCSIGESGCPTPTITREEQHARTMRFLLPWLAHFLQEDPQALGTFQALLTSSPDISYLQDCPAAAVEAPPECAGPSGPGARLALWRSPAVAGADLVLRLETEQQVEVAVYDLNGRQVRRLYSGTRHPGRYDLAWDGLDDSRRSLPAGCYLCRLDSHPEVAPVRVMLVR